MMQQQAKQSVIRQTQVYDDLSSLVVTFKRLTALAESVAICLQKDQDIPSLLLKITGLLQTLEPLKDKYLATSESNYIQELTFFRFGNRLLEVIAFMKNKSQNKGSSHHFSILNGCLRQIEAGVKHYKQSKELFQLIKKIQISFLKFCKNSQVTQSVFSGTAQEDYEGKFNQIGQKHIRNKLNEYKCQKSCKLKYFKTDMNQSSSEDSDSKSQKGFRKGGNKRQNWLIRKEYGKQLKKPLGRFETLNHLDLDFSYFKSDYWSAKENQQLFFRQYLGKNLVNKRIIANYYDDFWLFLRKRSHRHTRKDKIKIKSDKFQQQISNKSSDLSQRQIQLQYQIENEGRKQSSKDKVKVTTKFLKLQQQYPSKLLDCDGKRQLKLKNVQITVLNMSNEFKQPKIHSNFNYKRSKLDPACINQSYYNGLEAQAETSLLFLQRKLKVEADLNKSLKKVSERQAKHDISKKQLNSLSQISKLSNLFGQNANSKSSLKEKYLSVGNKRDKREQQDRIFLSKERSTGQKATLKNVRNVIKREIQGKLIISNQE